MNITVFLGSSLGNKEIYKEKTIELGYWIAENNHTLVYGGSSDGLMGVLAHAVSEKGSETIGVVPEILLGMETPFENLTYNHPVENIPERKQLMMELGDVFLALPGGPGTLEEIIEVIANVRTGLLDVPCFFINLDGYYNELESFFQHMVQEGFASKRLEKYIFFVDSIEHLNRQVDQFFAN